MSRLDNILWCVLGSVALAAWIFYSADKAYKEERAIEDAIFAESVEAMKEEARQERAEEFSKRFAVDFAARIVEQGAKRMLESVEPVESLDLEIPDSSPTSEVSVDLANRKSATEVPAEAERNDTDGKWVSEWEASVERVATIYPEAFVQGSEFCNRVEAAFRELEARSGVLLNDPRHPEIIAEWVEEQMALAHENHERETAEGIMREARMTEIAEAERRAAIRHLLEHPTRQSGVNVSQFANPMLREKYGAPVEEDTVIRGSGSYSSTGSSNSHDISATQQHDVVDEMGWPQGPVNISQTGSADYQPHFGRGQTGTVRDGTGGNIFYTPDFGNFTFELESR